MGLLSCPCLCISRAVAVAAAHYNLFEVVEVSKKFSDKHVGWHSFKAPSVSQREGDRGRSCRVVGKTKDIVIHKIYSSFQFNVINWPQLINAANTIQKPKRRFHADNKWMDRLEVCLWYYDDGDGPYNHADGYMRHIAKCAVILQKFHYLIVRRNWTQEDAEEEHIFWLGREGIRKNVICVYYAKSTINRRGEWQRNSACPEKTISVYASPKAPSSSSYSDPSEAFLINSFLNSLL